MSDLRLHTVTSVPAVRAWDMFRLASAGGGSAPQWTEHEDPADWHSPPDAAGTLVYRLARYEDHITVSGAPVRTAVGWEWRVEPARPDSAQAIAWALGAAQDVDLIARGVMAAYVSCGGRRVFLVRGDGADTGQWWVCIARPEDTPRIGASERNMLVADRSLNIQIMPEPEPEPYDGAEAAGV